MFSGGNSAMQGGTQRPRKSKYVGHSNWILTI